MTGHHLIRYSPARRVAAAQRSLSQSASCRGLGKQRTLAAVAEYSRQQDDLVRRVSSPEAAARLVDLTTTTGAHGGKYVSRVIERSADDSAADAQMVYEPRSPQQAIRTVEENLSLRSQVGQLLHRALESSSNRNRKE